MRARLKLTIDDLPSAPREDGRHWELIDGDPYLTTAPHFRHQFTVGAIFSALDAWNAECGVGLVVAGSGVIFSRDDAVIPDLIWFRKERLAELAQPDGKFHAAPDLVVEVLSPGADNEARDRVTKLRLYSLWGVREYWSVDWQAGALQVNRRGEDALLYLVATLGAGDTLTSPMLLGFSAAVGRICNPLGQ